MSARTATAPPQITAPKNINDSNPSAAITVAFDDMAIPSFDKEVKPTRKMIAPTTAIIPKPTMIVFDGEEQE